MLAPPCSVVALLRRVAPFDSIFDLLYKLRGTIAATSRHAHARRPASGVRRPALKRKAAADIGFAEAYRTGRGKAEDVSTPPFDQEHP